MRVASQAAAFGLLGFDLGKMSVDLRAALREKFGFDDFTRAKKKSSLASCAARIRLAILATGAGKSLTYQLPALLLDGTTSSSAR